MVNKNIDTHPNWYFDVPDMKLLILGTFPPHVSKRKFEFYYPNPSNRFWPTIASLAGVELKYFSGDQAVKERQGLMMNLGIGIQNIGCVIQREGSSSADKDIKIISYQENIRHILTAYPNLKSVLLTGFTGESSTFEAFIRYLDMNKIRHDAPDKVTAGSFFTIDCGRQMKCWIGNSGSTTK